MEPLHPPKVVFLVILSLASLTVLCSAGINFKIPLPSFSFANHLLRQPPPAAPRPHNKHPPIPPHPHHVNPHHRPHPPPLVELEHTPEEATAVDTTGAFYLHDPGSVVNFYFKENHFGPSKRINIHHDGCRDVPVDYWHQKPKSLWAKHCVTLYQNAYCHGEGTQVAGMVHELRSAGMHAGIASFRPCDKNIRIKFLPPANHHQAKHHHSHPPAATPHHHHHHH